MKKLRRKGEPAERRDSGYSGQKGGAQADLEITDSSVVKHVSISMDTDQKDSGDSGVGSPSPHTIPRVWGRRATRSQELKLIATVKSAVERLASDHGGEVILSYNPRPHPNLSNMTVKETRLKIPAKTWERSPPSSTTRLVPGAFLAKSRLQEIDILEGRLPDMPTGGLAVISNGLSLDLYRMVLRMPSCGPTVAQYLFDFLELSIPEVFLPCAVEKTLDCLRENLTYVEECNGSDESTTFLFSPFQVPEDVQEMASVLAGVAEESEHHQLGYSESLVGTVSPLGDGTAMLNGDELAGGFDFISNADNLILSNCQVMSDGNILVGEDWGGAGVVGGGGGGSLEYHDVSVIPTNDFEQVLPAGLAQTVFTEVHSEDENFSFTATLLDPASLEKLMVPGGGGVGGGEGGSGLQHFPAAEASLILSAESQTSPTFQPVFQLFDDLEPNSGDNLQEVETVVMAGPPSVEATTPGGTKKRSRTREVHVPTRYKDFDELPSPLKRK